MGFIDVDLGLDRGSSEPPRRVALPASTARPLDLVAWEVQAIAAGAASSLLRPIDPQPFKMRVKGRRRSAWAARLPDASLQDVEADAFGRFRDTCPFGKAGEALFIREAWTSIAHGRHFGIEIHYRADGNNDPNGAHRERDRHVLVDAPDREDRWRPICFEPWREASTMPAWASRISSTVQRVEVVDLENLTPYTLAACGPLPLRPITRWCWRIDLGAVVVIEPRK